MSKSITKNEHAALESALATGGKIRFELGGKRHPEITVVDGVTVVKQSTLDLQMSMESRGWIEYVHAPHVYKLTAAGTLKAQGLRPGPNKAAGVALGILAVVTMFFAAHSHLSASEPPRYVDHKAPAAAWDNDWYCSPAPSPRKSVWDSLYQGEVCPGDRM